LPPKKVAIAVKRILKHRLSHSIQPNTRGKTLAINTRAINPPEGYESKKTAHSAEGNSTLS